MPTAVKKRKKSLLNRLLAFDQKHKENSPLLIGVDEVGCGCLAGPVVAAAVLLPSIKPRTALANSLGRLNDSKLLTALERSKLSLILQEHAVWAIAEASAEEVDELNILQARLRAMKRAVNSLFSLSSQTIGDPIILVDGHKAIPELEHKQLPIIQGDGQSASIAAASVIAKVYRDQFMQNLAQSFPVYAWDQNKGYGSKKHRAAISEYGLSIWHRRTFIHNQVPEEIEELVLDDFDPESIN